MAVAEPSPGPEVLRLRRRLLLAAVATLLGIAWSVAVDPTMGGWVVVISFVALIATLHRFGRTGAS